MAKMQLWTDLDLDFNELQNTVIQKLPIDPAMPITGQIWFNTSENILKNFDGVVTKPIGAVEFSTSLTHLRYRPVGTSTWYNIMPLHKRNHVQDFSTTMEVLVDHNMNKFPSVTVIDSANTECEVSITHVDVNQLIARFTAPMSGKIICN